MSQLSVPSTGEVVWQHLQSAGYWATVGWGKDKRTN